MHNPLPVSYGCVDKYCHLRHASITSDIMDTCKIYRSCDKVPAKWSYSDRETMFVAGYVHKPSTDAHTYL